MKKTSCDSVAPLDRESVYRLVRMIPRGRVATYGAVARALGRPGAARAVGACLRRNPDPGAVPCHRVVRADGFPGGYFGGGARAGRRKMLRLAREGVASAGRPGVARLELNAGILFEDFPEERPLPLPGARQALNRR